MDDTILNLEQSDDEQDDGQLIRDFTLNTTQIADMQRKSGRGRMQEEKLDPLYVKKLYEAVIKVHRKGVIDFINLENKSQKFI
jgi:hypothetical protein